MAERDLKSALLEMAVAELPRGFVYELVRTLPNLYREAHARSYQDPAWEKTEAHDLCGHVRRSLCESMFRKVARKHGVQSKAIPNSQRSSFYTLARSGRLVLTQSALQFDWQMTRPALFRKQHAAVNNALINPFFPSMEIDAPSLSDPGEVYAVLLHGPRLGDARELGFAVLGFPDSDTHRMLYRFSLTEIAKAQSEGVNDETIVKDNVIPKLKRKRDAEGA